MNDRRRRRPPPLLGINSEGKRRRERGEAEHCSNKLYALPDLDQQQWEWE